MWSAPRSCCATAGGQRFQRRGRWVSESTTPRKAADGSPVRRGMVLGQQVGAPVPPQVAPHGVRVVRAVLRVVVLDQEGLAADRVVVRLAGERGPGPREADRG